MLGGTPMELDILIELVQKKDYVTLKAQMVDMQEADLAEFLDELEAKDSQRAGTESYSYL